MRPIVAATLVAASSTGMPAAISAPKASSISTSVTGRLIPSADDRSSATWSLMPASMVRSPASRTCEVRVVAAGRRRSRPAAARGVVLVLGELDRDQQRRPVRAPLRRGRRRSTPGDVAQVRRQRGGGRSAGRLVERRSRRVVISTFSVSGCVEVGRATIASARPDSPRR